MYRLFALTHVLFAQADAPAPQGGQAGGGGGTFPTQFIFMIGGFLILMYFLMVFPQKKERDRWNRMVENLKKNDKVQLQNGIIGIVHSIDKEKMELVLKVDEANNVKMTFTLTSIARVINSAE